MPTIASSHMRMNLLHAVLSMGKDVCAGSCASEDWFQREDIFSGMLDGKKKMTLKKGRALWRLPLFFIKVTSWINSKCRIYTTFKLWHKGTATRLGAKLWQCSLESLW